MRVMMVGLAMLGLAISGVGLSGCSNKVDKAQADAKAANFVPPSVTSRSDFAGMQDRRFRRMDRDGDGVLRHAELASTSPRLLRLDRNGDGRITAGEFSEGQMARFDAMDLNKDATLTSDERVEARGGR